MAAAMLGGATTAPRANATAVRGQCEYFVVFSRPHSSADVLCRSLNHLFSHQLNCMGELFSPKAATARTARSRAGFSVEKQRGAPSAFLKAVARSSACHTRLCGSLLLPFQLPNSALPELFATDCRVRVLVLERANRTAEYLDFRARASSANAETSAWSQMSIERFDEMHQEWFTRVGRAADATPSLRLTSEAAVALAADPAAAAAAAASSDASTPRPPSAETLQSLATFFGATVSTTPHRHASGGSGGGGAARTQEQQLEPQAPVLSIAGAKAASKAREELGASRRERRGRAVLLTAVTAFAATCLAGTCFALGTAVGQRYPDGLRRALTGRRPPGAVHDAAGLLGREERASA